MAQASSVVAPAASATKALGTVKAVSPGMVTLTSAAGSDVMVSVSAETKIVQLAPGSTDMKTAQSATLGDVAPGDRVLATGQAGATAGTLSAARLILMKGGAIAARNAAVEAEWRRGSGGLVRAVDGSTLTVSAGARTIMVEATPSTAFRRYSAGSIKFADARPGTLADIKPGDQVRVRGERSGSAGAAAPGSGTAASGTPPVTIKAEEIVSGSFRNLSGVITAVDLSTQTLTLQDTASKAPVTVAVAQSSQLRRLTPEAAATFSARGEHAGAGAASPTAPLAAAKDAGANPPGRPGTDGGGRSRDVSADLAAMMMRLPAETLEDLHPGDTVLLVASGDESDKLMMITLLSGVESILSSAGASGARRSRSRPGTWEHPRAVSRFEAA